MKKKFFLVCVFLVCLFILGACGNKENKKKYAITSDLTGLLDTRSIIVFEDRDKELHSVKTNNGRMIYMVMSFCDIEYYYIDDLEHLPTIPFCTFNISNADVLDYELSKEGNAYFIVLETLNKEEQIYLKRVNPITGIETNIKLLNGFYNGAVDDCYEWRLEVISNERILLYSHWGYWLIDENGEVLEQDRWKQKKYVDVSYIDEAMLFTQEYQDGDRKLSKIDESTAKLQSLEGISSTAYFDWLPYNKDAVLLRTDAELRFYDMKTNKEECLFKWSDYGIYGEDIIKFYIKNSALHCLLYESGKLYDVEFTEKEIDEQRTEMLLGCVGEQPTMRKAVAKFNGSQQDYFITIIDYKTLDKSAVMNQLYNDILAGRGPDLIYFDGEYITDAMLGREGALVDLNEYLNKSEVITQKDMVKSVYDAMLIENKLYTMPTNFVLDTIITKKGWFTEKDIWFGKDILEILEVNPHLKIFVSKSDMIRYGVSSSLVGEHFDTDTLRNYLECAKYMPENYVYEIEEAERRNGNVLFEYSTINGVDTYLYMKSVWGDDSVFLGFPEKNGNGAVITPVNSYGINVKSVHKDKAWEFIELFFTDEWQQDITPNWNFSICNNVLNRQLEDSMRFDTYVDRNGELQPVPILTYNLDGEYIDVYAANEQDIVEIREMIEGVKTIKRDDHTVVNIVQEEMMPYFLDKKSLDEAMEILEKRIQLFIYE